MNEMNHTPEPWKYAPEFDAIIVIRDNKVKAVADFGKCDLPENEANARRIVACVNACAGISTENLEENLPVKELARRYNDVLKQRDELLADIEHCYKMLLSEPDTKGALFKAENALREAIASVKEKK